MCNIAWIYSVYTVRDLPEGEVTRGGALALQEVKVTEQCELHTSLSRQQRVCKKVNECLFPRFCPQHLQHLLGFSVSTYLALLSWAVSFSIRCGTKLVPGNRCYLSTCLVRVPGEPSEVEN